MVDVLGSVLIIAIKKSRCEPNQGSALIMLCNDQKVLFVCVDLQTRSLPGSLLSPVPVGLVFPDAVWNLHFSDKNCLI